MKNCNECNKRIEEGHILLNEYVEIYFCEKCFAKLYTNEEQRTMYDNEEQYYTEFE